MVSGPAGSAYADDPAMWTTSRSGDELQILLNGKIFAQYSYRDPEVPRPYFCNFTTPSGVRITRNFPLRADDPQDHDKIHPGLWMAFGDLSGADHWRLTAPVKHARFTVEPQANGDKLIFAVENIYGDSTGAKEICREHCRYEFRSGPEGVLMLWDSTFHSDKQFVFGDQEEMGLGVRLNRHVAAVAGEGGRILNSNGQRNEAEAWSKQADWCDYSGPIGEDLVGAMIMPHPKNFRQSWCHCRDNGFMAMNPFGRNAFTGAEKSAVAVAPGKEFQLRYGVLFHWQDKASEFDADAAYSHYLQTVDAKP
jgi:hypothetical protein